MPFTQTPSAISARIDRLPRSGPLWSWVARISFGAFFEIYETALTSLISPLLVHVGIFHKDRGGLFGLPDLATFAFATFLGLFVGAVIFSAIADKMGRRPIFTYSLIWYALATLAMATQSNALSICLWRFIAAIGVGAEIVAVDAYLSEMMPKTMRGRGFAISKAIQYSAVPVAAILAAVLARKTVAGIEGWRVMLLVPTIGAVLIWWVRRGLPESPRWLAEHGRGDEAHAILNDVEARISQRIRGALPPIESMPAAPIYGQRGYMELFRGQLLQRTLMLLVVSCATTVAFFGFSNWLPSLLEARGVEVTKSLAYTALIGLAYPVGPFFFSFFADRSERKWQILAGAGLTVVGGLLFAAQTAVAGWLVCGLAITVGGNLASYGTHTYRSELFPTGVRARGIGFVYSIDRLVAAFNNYLIGFILVYAGVTGVLVFIAAASSVAMFAVSLFGPRTRGLATEAIRNRRGEAFARAPGHPADPAR
jgi:MFS transporter, putative metabolite:H+ symporter